MRAFVTRSLLNSTVRYWLARGTAGEHRLSFASFRLPRLNALDTPRGMLLGVSDPFEIFVLFHLSAE